MYKATIGLSLGTVLMGLGLGFGFSHALDGQGPFAGGLITFFVGFVIMIISCFAYIRAEKAMGLDEEDEDHKLR